MILYAATVYRGEDPAESRVHMHFKSRMLANFQALTMRQNVNGYKVAITAVDVGNAGDALLSQLNNPDWILQQPRKVLQC